MVVLLQFAVSCGSPGDDAEVEQTGGEKSEMPREKADDGRWMANPETTSGIKNMIRILNAFVEGEGVEPYAQLKKELEKELADIFKNCTMKGEAHNELHNFLMPVKEYLEELDSDDPGVCKMAYKKLSKHLAQYSTHFV